MDYVLASYFAWQGRPVRRKSWPVGVYVNLKGASLHIFEPKVTPTVWHYSLEDFRADDYDEVHTGLCRGKPAPEAGESSDEAVLDPQPDPS